MSALSRRPQGAVVGLRVPHESAALHVTGEALYTDDLWPRVAGALHAHPVQTAVAHGLVTGLDVAPALAVPGVVRVLTAADVPGVNDAGVKGDEPLFPDEVMYVGHPVAWVLAESLEAARLGAAAVVVDVETLPSIVTVAEAIAADSFQGGQPTVCRGDVDGALDAALAAGAHVFGGEFTFAGQEHFYLETHAALAHVDEADQVFVQSSTQHPSETQEIVAHVLGLPSHEVTVQCLRMGGGFGGKEMQPHGFAAIAALGAVLTGRPVRLRLSRAQDMTMTGKRHGFHAAWRVAFDEHGRLQALDATLTADGGWSLDLSEPVLARALCHVDNTYWIPNIRVAGRIARTHTVSNTAFRGFGGPQGMLVTEDILGRCAPLLGIDADELRRRNFYTEGQPTPYGQPVTQADRLDRCWSGVLASGDVVARRAEIEAFNAEHPHRKRALAMTAVKFGISFNLTAFNQAGALVHVYKDGSVLINHGGTEMGQGLHTKMLQVAATALGVPVDRVRLAPTRTDKVPNTSATAASSGSDLNGGAVRDACEQITGRLAQIAAGELGVHPHDVVFRDGVVSGLGADATLPWAELVRLAYFRRVQLWAAGFYRTEGLHWDSALMQGNPFKVLRVRGRGHRGRGRRIHRRVPHPPGRHLARRRRQPLAARRPRPGRGRLRAGSRVAHPRGPALGHLRRPRPRAVPHPGGEHLQTAELFGDADGFSRRAAAAGPRRGRDLRIEGGRRTTAHAGVFRARGAAAGGRGLRGAGRRGRPGLPGDPGGRVLGADAGPRVRSRRCGGGRSDRRAPAGAGPPRRAGAAPRVRGRGR